MNGQPEELPPSQISEARRRRRSHGFIPTSKGDRSVFVTQLAERLVANADFYLFSFLCGLTLAVAILLDNPAIYVLAALLAPFMAPVVGLGFATVVGSLRFFMQSLGSFLIGAALIFTTGALGGWVSRLIPNQELTQAHYHVNFSIPDFILLTIGIVLALYISVRAPKNRSLVASVALAYEIYIPISLAGFGLTSGFAGLFPQGLELAGVWLAWVVFIGTVFLAVLRLRPATVFGYLLTAVILAAALYTLVTNSAIGATLRSQMSADKALPSQTADVAIFSGVDEPSLTPTLTPVPETLFSRDTLTPTNTISPTATATQTLTPQPTPLYARVYSSTGESVYMRKAPGYEGAYLTLLKVNTLVEILDTTEVDGRIWVHILVPQDGSTAEGWIAQTLLQTATPAPGW